MKDKYYNFALFFIIQIIKVNSIVVIPFQLSIPREDNLKKNYTNIDFFYDFFLSDIYSSIYIGQNYLKILARISIENNTFYLSEEECKRDSLDNAQNYHIVTTTGYKFYESSTYKNISLFNNSLTNFKNGGLISENFSFYNTTKLSCQYTSYDHNLDKILDTKINITDMKVIIQEYTKNKICAVIGMGTPAIIYEGVNFINELKRIKAINDYSFTFKYLTSYGGQLIIGGLPHEYYNNSKLYKSYQYIKINSYSNNNYNYPWFIKFNKIFLENKNNTIINMQDNANCILVPNFGFIIGTFEYKKLIYEYFFKSLINEGICILEKTNNINNISLSFLNNEIFTIFSCDYNLYKEKYNSPFPTLKFQQNDFGYIFYLSFSYLFLKIDIFERYYFLVIFPEEKNNLNNNWYLGLPFLRRYQFIFNYDSKTIGFYNDKIKDGANKKNDTNNEIDLNNNSNIRLYIEISVIIILVLLIIAAFVVGKKMNDKRKKRANELNDDNYEYFSKDNKGENDLNIGV